MVDMQPNPSDDHPELPDQETVRADARKDTRATLGGSDFEHGRFEPGQRLGSRYRIVARLGEGGMGVVWKAQDTKLNRPVALKFLADWLHNDATALARLRREAKSAAALDHPYICKVYDTSETEDGRAFIAMEYVDGEPLASRLERERPLLTEALRIWPMPHMGRRGLAKPLVQLCEPSVVAVRLGFGTGRVPHRPAER